MNAGNLKVNFGGLEAAAADIQTSAKQVEARIDQLEADLAPLRSEWTGSASEAYQAAKTKWDTGMREIKQLLAEIGTAVTQSNTDYQTTENSNTGLWP